VFKTLITDLDESDELKQRLRTEWPSWIMSSSIIQSINIYRLYSPVQFQVQQKRNVGCQNKAGHLKTERQTNADKPNMI